MADVLYVRSHSLLAKASAKLVRKSGHTFGIVCSADAVRRLRRGGCRAVVLCWTSGQTGLAVARTAKKLGIPVIIVTNRLARAFRLFKSLAEVLLEQPARAEEVATLALELMTRAELAKSNHAPATKAESVCQPASMNKETLVAASAG